MNMYQTKQFRKQNPRVTIALARMSDIELANRSIRERLHQIEQTNIMIKEDNKIIKQTIYDLAVAIESITVKIPTTTTE